MFSASSLFFLCQHDLMNRSIWLGKILHEHVEPILTVSKILQNIKAICQRSNPRGFFVFFACMMPFERVSLDSRNDICWMASLHYCRRKRDWGYPRAVLKLEQGLKSCCICVGMQVGLDSVCLDSQQLHHHDTHGVHVAHRRPGSFPLRDGLPSSRRRRESGQSATRSSSSRFSHCRLSRALFAQLPSLRSSATR